MGGQCSCYMARKSSELVVDAGEADETSLVSTAPRPKALEHIDEVYALDIRQERILGHSSIGAVVKTQHRKSKEVFAVKQMNKNNLDLAYGLKEEVRTLTKLDHPHICRVSETWEDSMSVYIIMDLCKGGNLTTLGSERSSQCVNESSIAVLVQQMASAVSHLHSHKMVHSDIRPENWLFATPCHQQQTPMDMHIKMIDFGLASKHGKRSRRSSDPGPRRPGEPGPVEKAAKRGPNHGLQRSLFCKSPEQLGANVSADALATSEPAEASKDKADVWALGVISYFLLSGQSPFQWASYKEDLVRRAKYTFMPQELWRPVSSEAKNFIAMCLQRDPAQRPSSEKALALPWMKLARAAVDQAAKPGPGGSSSSSALPRTTSPAKLCFSDPPLETADRILNAFDHMHLLNALEKACVITAAHRIPADKIPDLLDKLASFDKQSDGIISTAHLFEGLLSCGVSMSDLMSMAKDYKDHHACVEYHEYIKSVDEFQRNLQDSVVWAVFRAFDGDGSSTVTKRDLWETLKQEDRWRAVDEKFPGISVEAVLAELVADGNAEVSAQDFKQLLRTFRQSMEPGSALENVPAGS